MKNLNFFNLVIVLAASFFTWNAVAAPVTIHLLDNLSAEESSSLKHTLSKMGYQTSKMALFEESKDAIIITKTIKNELNEEEYLKVEHVRLDEKGALPRIVFEYKFNHTSLNKMLQQFPTPTEFGESLSLTPMALQKE